MLNACRMEMHRISKFYFDYRSASAINVSHVRCRLPRANRRRADARDRVGRPAGAAARGASRRAAAERRVAVDVVSLSTRTVVYKALVTPEALEAFYPDLAAGDFESPFVTFHQRFSTNTSADWALAQPFRTLAHNGEINTIAGNRLWMRARMADATALPGFEHDTPMSVDGSDSRSLDDAIELLRHHGYSLAHAVSRLVPP